MTIGHYCDSSPIPKRPNASTFQTTTSSVSSKQSMSSANHLSPGLYSSNVVRTGSFREQGYVKPFSPGNPEDPSRRGSLPASSPNLLTISTSYDDVREGRENKEPSIRRVRSFKTTPKGVVNRGDSFRKKGARCGQYTRPSPPRNKDIYDHSPVPAVFSLSPDQPTSYFKVLVLGAPGVGKTSLAQQFMTSEYTAFDNSMDQDDEVKSVSVLLNGEESSLEFLDTYDNQEINIEEIKVDAYLVVFSIAHRETFDTALAILQELFYNMGTDRTTILVGNKSDLVRKRKVKTEEALQVALEHDAKYTETSAAVNHHVDDLLVGLLSQIRYKLNPSLPEPVMSIKKKMSGSRKSFKGPMSLLSRLFRRDSRKSKSGR